MSRKRTAGIALIAVSGVFAVSVFSLPETLIWNRTASAPLGLYWRSDGPLTLNGWTVVSAHADDVRWAAARGYVGEDWPIIKQVRGLPGAKICREDRRILIDGEVVAIALERDSLDRDMPVWSGCLKLQTEEVFLLNDHPDSLDGRYFGPTEVGDLTGTATLVWRSQ